MVKTIVESRITEEEDKMHKVVASIRDEEAVEMWNDFCRRVGDNGRLIYENTKENVLKALKAIKIDNMWDAICMIKNCDWHDDDTYFKIRESKDRLSGSKYPFSLMKSYDLVDYILENDEDFGHKEIREMLDSL